MTMLRLVDRTTRREFLRVGGLSLGGLTLAQLLARSATAASSPLRDKSVILLFLQGGPSQFETFDPKMDAPVEIRSTTGEIPTTLPGVTFGSTFTRLAGLAHKFSVVRSFRTGDGNHDLKPVVSREAGGANLGSLYARVAGSNHPQTGIPRNINLFPRAVDTQAQAQPNGFGNFESTGSLGSAFAPFVLGGDGNFQRDLVLNTTQERLADRRGLLDQLDRLRRQTDRSTAWQSLDRMQAQAFDTILGGSAAAFDLSREDARTLQRYDTSGMVQRERISTQWNNHKLYGDHAATIGRLLLMARRLCEAGAGFVTVSTNFVWDMHADANNAPCAEGMGYCGAPLDHALSAFIEDVEARGLRDKIMLVACGEMGRSPRLNSRGGREHWGGLAPLLLYGGGLQMGRIIGQSARDGGAPASQPLGLGNLVATIMHTLFDVGQLRLERGLPNEVLRAATDQEPIAGLI
jgi:uncharacterized protein (DUF1501 family)